MSKLDRLAICMMLTGIFLLVHNEDYLFIAVFAFLMGFTFLLIGVFETDNN